MFETRKERNVFGAWRVMLAAVVMAAGLLGMAGKAEAATTSEVVDGITLVYNDKTNTLAMAGVQETTGTTAGPLYGYIGENYPNVEVVWMNGQYYNCAGMFYGCEELTQIVIDDELDTSEVRTMQSMFSDCNALQTIEGINNLQTNRVTNMSDMFSGCTSLTTLDVSGFNTSNVTDMSGMFEGCTSLTTLDVSGFNTSNVTSMVSMFGACTSLTTLDVSGFNTSNVTSMGGMFMSCTNLTTLDASKWNTSNVKNLNNMFNNCVALTDLNVSKWDTSNVTTMSYMFNGCTSLTTLDVSGFNTSNVTSMSYMFYNCHKLLTLDVSSWNTSKVTSLSYIFWNCMALTDLNVSKWDTQNVTNMSRTFNACTSLTTLDVSKWDTSKVTNMAYMFSGCYALSELDVSGWDVGNVTTMENLFYYCNSLEVLDLGNWNASRVTNVSSMLGGDSALKTLHTPASISGSVSIALPATFYSRNSEPEEYAPGLYINCYPVTTAYTEINSGNTGKTLTSTEVPDGLYMDYDETSKTLTIRGKQGSVDLYRYIENNWPDVEHAVCDYLPTDCCYLFANCANLISVEFGEHWDVSSVADMQQMFYGCSNLTTVDVSDWDVSNVTCTVNMFGYCQKLTEIDVSNWDVSKLQSAMSMFGRCTALTTLDVSNWNTATLSAASNMFEYCTSLTELDVSNWNTENLSTALYMFQNCYKLTTIDVSKWNTSKLSGSVQRMFAYCSSLNAIDISGWKTEKITDMHWMFAYCSSLTSLNVSNIDTSNVTDFSDMFLGCKNVTLLDVGGFNTSKATDISGMFSQCEKVEFLDVNDWDTSKVTNTSNTFAQCSSLKTLDLSKWNTSSMTYMTRMFANCYKLTDLRISDFDTSKVTSMYGLFDSCRVLTELDLSKWDVSKVTSMERMFVFCNSLEVLDLSNWNASSVTNVGSMLYGDYALKTLRTPASIAEGVSITLPVTMINKDTMDVYDTVTSTDSGLTLVTITEQEASLSAVYTDDDIENKILEGTFPQKDNIIVTMKRTASFADGTSFTDNITVPSTDYSISGVNARYDSNSDNPTETYTITYIYTLEDGTELTTDLTTDLVIPVKEKTLVSKTLTDFTVTVPTSTIWNLPDGRGNRGLLSVLTALGGFKIDTYTQTLKYDNGAVATSIRSNGWFSDDYVVPYNLCDIDECFYYDSSNGPRMVTVSLNGETGDIRTLEVRNGTNEVSLTLTDGDVSVTKTFTFTVSANTVVGTKTETGLFVYTVDENGELIGGEAYDVVLPEGVDIFERYNTTPIGYKQVRVTHVSYDVYASGAFGIPSYDCEDAQYYGVRYYGSDKTSELSEIIMSNADPTGETLLSGIVISLFDGVEEDGDAKTAEHQSVAIIYDMRTNLTISALPVLWEAAEVVYYSDAEVSTSFDGTVSSRTGSKMYNTLSYYQGALSRDQELNTIGKTIFHQSQTMCYFTAHYNNGTEKKICVPFYASYDGYDRSALVFEASALSQMDADMDVLGSHYYTNIAFELADEVLPSVTEKKYLGAGSYGEEVTKTFTDYVIDTYDIEYVSEDVEPFENEEAFIYWNGTALTEEGNLTAFLHSDDFPKTLAQYEVVCNQDYELFRVLQSDCELTAEYNGETEIEGLCIDADKVTVQGLFTVQWASGNVTTETTCVDAEYLSLWNGRETVVGAGEISTTVKTSVSLTVQPGDGQNDSTMVVGENHFVITYTEKVSHTPYGASEETVMSDVTRTVELIVTGVPKSAIDWKDQSITATYAGQNPSIEELPIDRDAVTVKADYTIVYDNDTEEMVTAEDVTAFTVTGPDALVVGDNTYTVSATVNGEELTTTFVVRAEAKQETEKTDVSFHVTYSGEGSLLEGYSIDRSKVSATVSYTQHYDNGTSEEVTAEPVPAENLTIEGPEKLSVGENTYTVSATVYENDLQDTFTVTGIAKSKTGEEFLGASAVYTGTLLEETMPAKENVTVTYRYRDVFNNGTYGDEATRTVTDFEITGENAVKEEENTYTVTFDAIDEERQTTFTVTGTEKTEESQEITGFRASYSGTNPSIEGLTIDKSKVSAVVDYIIHYNNGTTRPVTGEAVTVTPSMVTGAEPMVIGDNTYAVTATVYGEEKTATFTVNAAEKQETGKTIDAFEASYSGQNPSIEGLSIDRSKVSATVSYTIHYDNGSIFQVVGEAVTVPLTISGESDVLSVGENTFAVSASVYGHAVSDEIIITAAEKQIVSYEVTDFVAAYAGTNPSIEALTIDRSQVSAKTSYIIHYDNGTSSTVTDEVVSDFEVTGPEALTVGDNTYTVSATVHGHAVNGTFTVEAAAKQPVSYEITGFTASYAGVNPSIEELPIDQTKVSAKVSYVITYDNHTTHAVTDEVVTDFVVSGPEVLAIGDNTYTVSATVHGHDVSDTFTVEAATKQPVSYEIADFTVAYAGTNPSIEELPIDQTKVSAKASYTITYDNGTHSTVTDETVSDFTVSGPDALVIGDNTYTVSATVHGHAVSDTFTVTAEEKQITDYEITAFTARYSGTNPSIEGLAIDKSLVSAEATYVISYNNGSHETVTGEAVAVPASIVSGHAVLSVGPNTYTVNASVHGKPASATFTVTARAKAVDHYEVTSFTATYTGDAPITEGFTIDESKVDVKASYIIHYDNGDEEAINNVTVTGSTISGPEKIAVGDNTYTVSGTVQGIAQQATFTVTGKAKVEASRTVTAFRVSYAGAASDTEGFTIDESKVSAECDYTISYNNGDSDIITGEAVTGFTITGPEALAVGTNTYTVTATVYNSQQTDTFTVTGLAKEETNREVTDFRAVYTGPSSIIEGLTLDKTKVSAEVDYIITYNNHTTRTVTGEAVSSVAVTGNEKIVVGENTYTVSVNIYGSDQADDFTVTGVEKSEVKREVVDMAISCNPLSEGLVPAKDDITVTYTYRITYDNGDTLDVPGNVVTDEENLTITAEASVNGTAKTGTVTYTAFADTANEMEFSKDFTYYGRAKEETGREPVSIAATTTQTSQVEGLDMDASAVSVTCTYLVRFDNGTQANETLPLNSSEYSITDAGKKIVVGENTYHVVLVADEDITTTFTVTGNVKEVTHYEITGADLTYTGTKVEGLQVEKSNVSGTIDYVTYYNNGTQDVTEDEALQQADFTVETKPIVKNVENSYEVAITPAALGGATYTANLVFTGEEKSIFKTMPVALAASHTGTVLEAMMPLKENVTVTYSYKYLYNNGTESEVLTRTIPAEDYALTGENAKKNEETTYTVTYTAEEGTSEEEVMTATFAVTGTPKSEVNRTVNSFEVSYSGANPSIEGLTIDESKVSAKVGYTIHYDNGSTFDVENEVVTAPLTIEGPSVLAIGENTFAVSATVYSVDVNDTFTVRAAEKSETGRTITSFTAAYTGTNPSIEGLSIDRSKVSAKVTYVISYDNGSARTVTDEAVTEFSITGPDALVVGDNTYTVSATVYGHDVSSDFTVTAAAKQPVSYEVTDFTAGYAGTNPSIEALTIDRSQVSAKTSYIIHYDNGTTDAVTDEVVSDFEVTGPEALVIGDNTYTVSATVRGHEVSDTFAVAAAEKQPVSYEITSFATAYAGTNPSIEGLSIDRSKVSAAVSYVITYDNGSASTVTDEAVTDLTVIGPEVLAIGDNTYTVSATVHGHDVNSTFTVSAAEKQETDREITAFTAAYGGANPSIEALTIDRAQVSAKTSYIIHYDNGSASTVTDEVVTSFTVTGPEALAVGDNTYTVAATVYGHAVSDTFTVAAAQKQIVSYEMTGFTAVYAGDNPTIEGLAINRQSVSASADYIIHYDNGTEETVTGETVDAFTVSGPERVVVGDNIYTVSGAVHGHDVSDSFTVVAAAKQETEREITSFTASYAGTNPELEERTIDRSQVSAEVSYIIHYDNGTTESILGEPVTDFTVTGPEALAVGDNAFTVSAVIYGSDVTTDFTVTGLAKSEVSREITSFTVRYEGVNPSIEGLALDEEAVFAEVSYIITYDNGTTREVTGEAFTDITTLGARTYVVGDNTYTVTGSAYGTPVSDTFTVTAREKEEASREVTAFRVTYAGEETLPEGLAIDRAKVSAKTDYIIHYDNGTEEVVEGEEVPAENLTIAGNEVIQVGDNRYDVSATVYGEEVSDTFTVEGTESQIVSKEITEVIITCDETTVPEGLAADLTGITVEIITHVVLDNHVESDVRTTVPAENYLVVGPDVVQVGDNVYTVQVEVENLTANETFVVTGTPKKVTEITADDWKVVIPAKKKAGDPISASDLTITYEKTTLYDNNTEDKEAVTASASDITIEAFDSTDQTAVIVIKVKVGDQVYELTVPVKDVYEAPVVEEAQEMAEEAHTDIPVTVPEVTPVQEVEIVQVTRPEVPSVNTSRTDIAEPAAPKVPQALTVEVEEASENALKVAKVNLNLKDEDVLSDEEKAAVAGADDYLVTLSLVISEDSESEDDKGKVSQMLPTSAPVYFDIKLLKKVVIGKETSESYLTEVPENIQVALEIPENILAEEDSRLYRIVRVHDGVAEILKTQRDGDVLWFETNKFSTYAIVFVDKELPVSEEEAKEYLETDAGEELTQTEATAPSSEDMLPEEDAEKAEKMLAWICIGLVLLILLFIAIVAIARSQERD